MVNRRSDTDLGNTQQSAPFSILFFVFGVGDIII